jgi:ankyrin repeat protein
MPSPIDELIAASVRGDWQAVQRWLETDPALATAANMFGSTAVHAAHYSGHTRIVKLLVPGYRPLDGLLAAELGAIDELREQLRKQPDLPRERNTAGFTLLHGACYWGSIGAVRLLLGHGADVNAPTTDSFLQIHPLGCAVAAPDVPNPSQDESVVLGLAELLIEAGADANARRRDGITALHSAAYRGHLRVIRRLLAAGADAGIRARDDAGGHAGQTAAETARSQGQTAAAEFLGGLGKDPKGAMRSS